VHRRIAYLSLQAVVDGQDSWAAVNEIISGWEAEGWIVARYFPAYRAGETPGVLSRLSEMYRVQRRLMARIGEYDAVYVRAHPVAWLCAWKARRVAVPIVHECNGPYDDLFIAWPITRIARPLFVWLQRSQYDAANAIITVTEGLRTWLLQQSANRVVVTVGNGANVETFSPEAERRRGLPERYGVFFGQFAAWQGIPVLLEAAQSPVWPEDLALVFVGDGVMRPAVEDAVRRNPERIAYVGRLPYAEVGGVVAHAIASFVPLVAADADMLHSPLKLYESMACGVPVIASDTRGVAEVVRDERCGLLVTPGDAAGVVAALVALLERPHDAADMGRRGRSAAVARYSWRARADQRRDVVESAIVHSDRSRISPRVE